MSSSSTPVRHRTPEYDSAAKAFFFREFVSLNQFSFLDPPTVDEFLMKPILACAQAAMYNRSGDVRRREASRACYVEVSPNASIPWKQTFDVCELTTLTGYQRHSSCSSRSRTCQSRSYLDRSVLAFDIRSTLSVVVWLGFFGDR